MDLHTLWIFSCLLVVGTAEDSCIGRIEEKGFYGGSLIVTQFKQDNPVQCGKRCCDNEDCKIWVWRSRDNMCHLKNNDDPSWNSKEGHWSAKRNDNSCAKRLCTSTDGCSLARNTSLTSLPKLRKEFSVSFELQAKEYISGWQSVLHFTEGGRCCEVGHRIPALYVRDEGQMHPCFAVDGEGNYNSLTDKKYSLNEWHSVKFSQSLKNGKYMYHVTIDGETVIGPVENKQPASFSNVRVYAANPWDNALKGSIKNLCINPGFDDSCFEHDIHHIGFGLNKPGGDNNYGATGSGVGCQLLCQKTAGCAWFNWDRTKDECWLKTGKGNRDAQLPGAVTGPRTC